MSTSTQLANQIRELYFGKSWTAIDYQSQLADVSLDEAMTSYEGLNSIATLLYHTTYYVDAQLMVLRGEELKASDKESFIVPEIDSENDWENLKELCWQKVGVSIDSIESMSEETLHGYFYGEKYGSWFRNIMGLAEHSYYHLGQISIIKKLLRKQD